jgi:uncharacterized protein
MALGMQGSFNILRQSPHDLSAGSAEENPSVADSGLIRWKPSRYNIRATGEDGGFILWNTLSNAISVFRGEQIPLVEKALRGVEARKKGTIKYLVDRGFLVREGTNEYHSSRSASGRSTSGPTPSS